MPTYQYQCTACGNALEVRQSFSDDALTVCPDCDGALRKVFNAVGVVFKGSGFYRNDSRSAATQSTPAGATAKSDSGTKADSTAKSDSSASGSGGSGTNGSSSSTSSSSAPSSSAGSSTSTSAA